MFNTKYILPDGTCFKMWDDKTIYKTVLHVSQKSGSMDGDGSMNHPFLKIEQAIPLAVPGTKVIIHEGVYRETVRIIFSGKSASEMVMFCGADGESVEITGAEIFDGEFRISEGWKRTVAVSAKTDFAQKDAKVYMTRLKREAFIGVNPFSMANGPLIPWYKGTVGKLFQANRDEERETTTQKRGMLFCDGERMEQVLNYFQLGEKDNRYFVEDDGLTVHLRFKNDSSPKEHFLEFTAREQCFCPEEKYFSYIHVKGLSFTKGGNGFPPPQRGILSTNCGNHWLIEDCRVLDANGVGADIGFQCPTRYSNEERGGTIVRNCEFSRCGIVGLTGTPGGSDIHYLNCQQSSICIENNRFIDNCWWDFEWLMENASLKLHRLNNSVIINNYINGTLYGCGIWMDAFNTNLLVEGNVVLHTKNQYGAIFIEASKDDLQVSHNIVVDSKINKLDNGGNGIYSHTCEDIKTIRNISLGCENSAIMHHSMEPDAQRTDGGSGQTGNGFDTFENIVSDSAHLVVLGSEHCQVDRNIYGNAWEVAPLRIERPRIWEDLKHWRKNFHFDINGREEEISYALNNNDSILVLSIGSLTFEINLNVSVIAQIDSIFSELWKET